MRLCKCQYHWPRPKSLYLFNNTTLYTTILINSITSCIKQRELIPRTNAKIPRRKLRPNLLTVIMLQRHTQFKTRTCVRFPDANLLVTYLTVTKFTPGVKTVTCNWIDGYQFTQAVKAVTGNSVNGYQITSGVKAVTYKAVTRKAVTRKAVTCIPARRSLLVSLVWQLAVQTCHSGGAVLRAEGWDCSCISSFILQTGESVWLFRSVG